MSSTALGLVALLALLVVVLTFVALGFFIRLVLRRDREENRRTALASQCFTGAPEVVVNPAQWQLPVDDVRRLAVQCGYMEAGQPQPGVIIFRSGAPAEGHGTAPAPRPPVSAGKADKLLAPLAGRDFVWVEAAEIGGSERDIAALAMQRGANVLRAYGDRTNPMLLIGKRPVRHIRDAVSPGERKPLPSMTQLWLSRGLMAGSLIPMLAGAKLAEKPGSPALGWTLVGIAAAMFIAAVIFMTSFVTRSATSRMMRLIHEFDGRSKVTISGPHYRFDRLTYLDLAAELGYAHLHTRSSWMTNSRWSNAWITFIRQPVNPAPMEGHRS
ncbi:MAG: hypothetical protein GEU86_10245 [Actinophytocola sp.]|nr:hypothetical protein [Actinophytocola sp.]